MLWFNRPFESTRQKNRFYTCNFERVVGRREVSSNKGQV